MNEATPRSYTFNTLHRYYASNQGWVSSRSVKSMSWSDTRAGTGLKGWAWLIKHCYNASTQFTGSRNVCGGNKAVWEVHFQNSRYNYKYVDEGHILEYSNLSPYYPSDANIQTETQNRAMMSFIKKAKAHQHEFAGGVFLGELDETIRLIAEIGEAIWGLTHIYTRGLVSLPWHELTLRNFANAWLTYSFGVKPLIGDMQDLYKAYNNQLNKRTGSYVHAQATERADRGVTSGTGAACLGNLQMRWTQVDREDCTTVYRGFVLHELYGGRAANIKSFAQHYGLDMDSWVPTIWELVPWSFLVDYFLNVGNVLEAVYFRKSSVRWMCQTQRRTRLRSTFAWPDAAATKTYLGRYGYTVTQASGAPAFIEQRATTVSRTRCEPAVPPLQFQLPRYSTQWLNMAALAATRGQIQSRGVRR